MKQTHLSESEDLVVQTSGLTKRYGACAPAVDSLDVEVRLGDV